MRILHKVLNYSFCVVSAVAIAVYYILKGITGDAPINKEELKNGVKLAIGYIGKNNC